MSLLMKALEKAAKDREEADSGRAAAAPAGAAAPLGGAASSEFTLEPLAPQRQSAPAEKPHPLSPSPGESAGDGLVAPAPPAAASRESMLAATTVIRASARDSGGGLGSAIAYVREQPLIVLGPIAALLLIGYGSYIYLQMTSPNQVAKQPAARVQSAAPATPTPPAPAVAAASGSTGAAPQPPIPVTSLLASLQEGAIREKPAPKPVAAAAVAPAATPAPERISEPAPAPTAVRDTIKITAGGPTPTINPLLAEAYAALNSGNFELAPRLYNQLLRSEPNNVDALLGLAAIATQQGDTEQASRNYLRVLEVEPRNALAQAGLIGMFDRADPLAAESRLKQLIARDPSAHLYFTLGNVYADQNRWPDAQQAYFQAHHLQSGNPDYAYNLAVGLEHVGQPKLALENYRRALQLVAAKGRANFSTAAVQERIGKLEKIVQ